MQDAIFFCSLSPPWNDATTTTVRLRVEKHPTVADIATKVIIGKF
jgi:hypothetical protein